MITFEWRGLTCEAEGDYEPLIPGTYWEPPEGGYFETHELTCEGKNATFLLHSDLSSEIDEAAYAAILKGERDGHEPDDPT
tara:strand:+ start:1367 stop:1609 length:243 start_codon:yes stop_codon:yes gene_type:complete